MAAVRPASPVEIEPPSISGTVAGVADAYPAIEQTIMKTPRPNKHTRTVERIGDSPAGMTV